MTILDLDWTNIWLLLTNFSLLESIFLPFNANVKLDFINDSDVKSSEEKALLKELYKIYGERERVSTNRQYNSEVDQADPCVDLNIKQNALQ